MSGIANTVLIVVLVTMLATLGSSRIIFCIRLLAAQGMFLSALPVAAHSDDGWRAWVMALTTFGIKGFALPRLLLRARREADVPREVEPYVGFGASILTGLLLIAAAFWGASRLPLSHMAVHPLALPVSLSGLLGGLFLIVSRRKAIMHVVGFLTLENGVFIFGIMFVRNQPLVVEMGVLLDLLVGVFVMGIAIFHISRELKHVDVDRLVLLKDTPAGEEAGL